MASREHARIHVGSDGGVPVLTIEDAGSANGTRVRDVVIKPGEPAAILPGEAIMIGSTVLMVCRTVPPRGTAGSGRTRTSRRASRNKCARAAKSRAAFALARIRFTGAAPWTRVTPVLAREVAVPHVFASYGPKDYEVLFLDISRARPRGSCKSSSRRSRPPASTRRRPSRGTRKTDGQATRCWRRPTLLSSGRRAAAERRAHRRPTRAGWSGFGPWRPGPPPRTSTCSSSARRASARTSSRARSTAVAARRASRSSRSTARRCPRPCSRASSSATSKGAFTGAVAAQARACSRRPTAAPCSSTRSASCRRRCRRSCCACSRAREVMPRRRGQAAPDRRPLRRRDQPRPRGRGRARARSAEDLFFRLNALTLAVPPLARAARRDRRARARRSSAATPRAAAGRRRVAAPRRCERLARYAWPGNVRELKNAIERAVVLSEEQEILAEHLPLEKMCPRLASWSSWGPISSRASDQPAGDGPAAPQRSEGGRRAPANPRRPRRPRLEPDPRRRGLEDVAPHADLEAHRYGITQKRQRDEDVDSNPGLQLGDGAAIPPEAPGDALTGETGRMPLPVLVKTAGE